MRYLASLLSQRRRSPTPSFLRSLRPSCYDFFGSQSPTATKCTNNSIPISTPMPIQAPLVNHLMAHPFSIFDGTKFEIHLLLNSLVLCPTCSQLATAPFASSDLNGSGSSYTSGRLSSDPRRLLRCVRFFCPFLIEIVVRAQVTPREALPRTSGGDVGAKVTKEAKRKLDMWDTLRYMVEFPVYNKQRIWISQVALSSL